MPIEFATREELNGLGGRVNQAERALAAHKEAEDTAKQDRRDIWSAVAEGRAEDKRIERMVNQIALRVAAVSAVFSILTTIAVALVVKFITKG